MFGTSHDDTTGVLIDIGSASVVVAIVYRPSANESWQIMWSHRDHISIHQGGDTAQLAKNVLGSFINCTTLLESQGLKKIREQYPTLPTPRVIQVSVAAPWSYTVTKTVSYAAEEPFTIDEDLCHELETTAAEKTEHELASATHAQELGLTVVARMTGLMTANGYPVTEPLGQRARSLSIAHTSAIVQTYLVEALHNFRDAMFPAATLHTCSYMMAYNHVLHSFLPHHSDLCLLHVSYEATEVGMVRDGVLTYCTHIPYGSFSLARDIAAASKTPLHESYARLTKADLFRPHPTHDIDQCYAVFREKIVSLLRETGDTLTIPKTIVVHANAETETFLAEHINAAAGQITKSPHHVIAVTEQFIAPALAAQTAVKDQSDHDTSIFLSHHFFHTTHTSPSITWS
jgi:hypothetical protein